MGRQLYIANCLDISKWARCHTWHIKKAKRPWIVEWKYNGKWHHHTITSWKSPDQLCTDIWESVWTPTRLLMMWTAAFKFHFWNYGISWHPSVYSVICTGDTCWKALWPTVVGAVAHYRCFMIMSRGCLAKIVVRNKQDWLKCHGAWLFIM